jgi:hypothetical protein
MDTTFLGASMVVCIIIKLSKHLTLPFEFSECILGNWWDVGAKILIENCISVLIHKK